MKSSPPESSSASVLAGPGSGWSRYRGTVLRLVVSVAIVSAIYRRLDVAGIVRVLRSADPTWLVISLAATVPITVLIALRFYWVVPPGALPGAAEAIRLTLVSNSLNLFLPAKAGDLAKSFFLNRRGGLAPAVGVSVVVYERLSDLFALISWCVVGGLAAGSASGGLPVVAWVTLSVAGAAALALVTREGAGGALLDLVHAPFALRWMEAFSRARAGWVELHRSIRGRRVWLAALSLTLWLAQFSQIWMFARTFSARVPFFAALSAFALALIAAQVPFTFAGLGPRDLALVLLLAPWMPAETAAAVGILMTVRALLPPLSALPILRPYLSTIGTEVLSSKPAPLK